MGREVRRVPAFWEHPRYTRENARPGQAGSYIPLLEWRDLKADQKKWDKNCRKWEEGLVWSSEAKQYVSKDPAYRHKSWAEYDGRRPSYAHHMPMWTEEQCTHYQMYEDTSEGTPISPVMASPEELARWLVDHRASSFGEMTATYEQWLAVCRGGWAPSLVITNGVMQSGVAHAGAAAVDKNTEE